MTATYKTVKIFKEQVLGIGSYGKVCKARCDQLPCAAKILHETLFDPNSQRELNEAEKKPIRKFEREHEFLRQLKHPNIVQYLDVSYEDPSTGLPALLMELMDGNLTKFLENATQPIRYDVQVNLCHDISLALSYLHSNGIIHRDLSSNNVLLIGCIRAKVADFGMAKLSDLNLQGSLTTTSRSSKYLPPECCKANPTYSNMVDCFSFGVLIVQILTRKKPNPGDELKKVKISDPSFPSGFVKVPATEVERRQDHISEINPNHPLRPLALMCLKDEPDERPSAQQLCEELDGLKQSQDYKDISSSVTGIHEGGTIRQHGISYVDGESTACVSTCEIGVNTEKDELVMQLKEQVESQKQLQQCNALIKEKEEKIEAQEEEIEQKDDKIRELEQRVESQQEVIQQQRQQLEEIGSSYKAKNQVIAERERKIAEISQCLSACTAEKDSLEKCICELNQYWTHKSLILKWKRDSKKAPRAMYRSNDAVVDGNKAYFRPARTREIYSYQESQGWNRLSDCPYESSPLVIINGTLTAVGGCRNGSCTDKLCSLPEGGNKRKWTEELLPHMPTKRSHTSTLCTGAYLIVAGGKGEREVVLRTVEVLNVENHQWYSALDLPEPSWCSSMTILDGHLFVMGGVNSSGSQTNLVCSCSLEIFLRSLQNVRTSPEPQNGHSPERQSRTPLLHTSPNRQQQLTSSGELNGSISGTRAPMRQNGMSTEPHQNGGSCSPERQNGNTGSTMSCLWTRRVDLPVTQSTCMLFRGRLLAISGKTLNDPKPVSEIFVYCPLVNKWEVVGHMPVGRFTCFAAVLSTNQLMVVGGYTDNKTAHDSVEFAS